ncbi:MAG: GntR family transcriptional regulator [Pararhodobacter sp.]|nr:GntR family transcriptional regulator [Pararhodobacter sp.]
MKQDLLDPLSRPAPLAEQIYHALRDRLRMGAFDAEARLAESVLARDMNVSRSPVREALSRLVADGLLDTGAWGFRVPPVTATTVAEIVDLRCLIEPVAAARAAEAMPPEAIALLRRALEQAGRAAATGNLDAFLVANYAFRAGWVTHVANSRLRDTLARFDDQAGTLRRMTFALPGAREEALGMMHDGLGGFARRDPDAAAEFARSFVEAAARYFHSKCPMDGSKREELS